MSGLPAYAFRADEWQTAYQADSAEQTKVRSVATRSAQQENAAKLAQGQGLRVAWHVRLGTPSSVRGSDLGKRQSFSGGKGLRVTGGGGYQKDALAVLDNLSSLYRINNATNEFSVKRSESDEIGFQHVKLNQIYQGLRVVGGELIVHFNKGGTAYEVNGQYVPDIAVGTKPSIKKEQAVQIALDDLKEMLLPDGVLEKAPELVVFARKTSSPSLAYELTVSYADPQAGTGRWRYWIDALQGKILLRYNDVQNISAPTSSGVHATITGNLLAGEGGVSTNVVGWSESSRYYLYNTNFNWIIYNIASNGYFDAGTYAYRTNASWGTSDRAEISAAHNFNTIQQYYKQVHSRASFNNSGAIAFINVHEGNKYVNAYWSPMTQRMYIGDGDGVSANSLAVLDVLGHEYTHAVTEHTANLTYAYESGALNESFSDIFGTCIEFYAQQNDADSYPNAHAGKADWLLGEDCWLSSTALRDMRNPANAATVGADGVQPTLYQGAHWASGSKDNGGVHQNSGVQNFFFYLLCEGGTGINEGYVYNIKGIGITNAEQVAYRTLSHYCTADTDYAAVSEAWISAAEDLNPHWVVSVKRAWGAVLGITYTQPVIYTESPLPSGRIGTAYSCTLGVVGGEAPYIWNVSALPFGLTFDGVGTISGMPETSGTETFTATVTDDMEQEVTAEFSLTINDAYGIPFAETFESEGNLPDGWSIEYVSEAQPWSFVTGSPRSQPPSAHGGSYNACFAPEATGLVTRLVSPCIDFGTASNCGQLSFWHYMKVWAGDQDELRVYYKTALNGNWTWLATFQDSVATWTKQTVALPVVSRAFYLAFEGTSKYGYGVCLDDIAVFDPTLPLAITTESPLLTATAGVSYQSAISAVGGTSPYVFGVTAGALPSGLTINSNGVVAGTASLAQTAYFTVSVTDAVQTVVSKDFALEVEVPRADLFVQDFERDGLMPIGWTQEYVTNTVLWTAQTGDLLDGHPAGAASGGFFVRLWSDGSNGKTSLDHKTRLISPALALGQAPTDVRLTFWHYMERWDADQDELRVLYRASQTSDWVEVASFTTNVAAWTEETVHLPNTSSTCYIAFEGNARFGYGVCLDNVRISDAADAPIITTVSPLPDGEVQTPYYQTLTAVGGTAPYSWSVASSALPWGVALSTNGVISGTPVASGTAYFSVRVTDQDGKASVNTFSLTVAEVHPVLFKETFEHNGNIPTGWTQTNLVDSLSWTFRNGSESDVPSLAYEGSFNACLYNQGQSAKTSMLISPPLNLSTNVLNVRLTFWLCMKNYDGDQDELRVYYRAASGDAWNLLASYTENISTWTQQTITLPNLSSTYSIAFSGTAKWGYGVCIDNVAVVCDVESTSPYAIWKSVYFNESQLADPLISGGAADPDGDGIANDLEYALGLNPMSYDAEGFPVGGISNGYLTLNYRKNKAATDVVFAVEACTSLVSQAWSTNDVAEITSLVDTDAWWSMTAWHTVPVTNAPTRFMRLKVSLP